MKSPDAIQGSIIESFRERVDPLDQFDRLLQLASEMDELPDERKVKGALVSGCQSQVWLYPSWEGGRFALEGDSDTLMVRGVIRIFQLMYQGQSAQDVLDCPVRFVEETDLCAIFDPKRKMGVESIHGVICDSAQNAL